ncbi:MAG: VOC family protein [Senegalia sp. (in: firmicutes)]|uniref:VOC family protein n=1 Tax=Senegalia sp. (in: firmicutes) TaxID=1924098 RepID=UPI003F95DF95
MNKKDKMSQLDHIVIAAPELEALALEFYKLTGIKPIAGGSHEGKGTANQLIGLGEGRYIELIGPDKSQDNPDKPRPLRVDDVVKTTVVGWSVRPDNMDMRVNEARKLEYDPGDPKPMDRKTTSGEVLSWIITPLNGGLEGTVPFLIDWKDSKHPSNNLPTVKLTSLTITHPQPDKVRLALEAIRALDLVSEIHKGEVGLSIELDTPKGHVKIG